jgi:beta-galactosidase
MKYRKFNQGWKFWNEKNSFALVWNTPQDSEEVTLPHDAMHTRRPYAESPNGSSSGYRDGGNYVYVKSLFAPEEFRNRSLMLKFEGVYMNSFVYVNEQLAGKCPNGYVPFHVELNNFLRYGEANEIRVIVKNGTMNNSRWYSGGGIYRDVYLLESGLLSIVPDGVQIRTETLEDDYAILSISTELSNRSHSSAELTLETSILDPEGRLASFEKTILFMSGGQKRRMTSRVSIDAPDLWEEESPKLYSCETVVRQEGSILDQSRTSFGIRNIQVDAKQGFRINGRRVNLRGACIHHDSGLLGAATYYDAQYRQIKRLKEAGFNAVRMAHNTIAPAMLRACDELGMYVMDEAFDMWTRCKSDYDYGMFFGEFWEQDIEAMVRKNFNHPSVIMYSIGNEIPEIGTPYGSQIAQALSEKIKALDGSRFTLSGINGVFAAGDKVDQIVADVSSRLKSEGIIEGDVNNFMALMADHMDKIVQHPIITDRLEKACPATDIAGYNYMTARYEGDGKQYPNRIIVGSETYPPTIAENWKLVKALPYVIGDFTWTGWDYIGEAGVGIPGYALGEGGFGAKYPCQLAYCGDFDLTGSRRPLSFLREIVFGYRADAYIAVQNPHNYGRELMYTPWILSDAVPSWTWPGCEAEPVIVEVYSPGDEVELLLNGRSLGRKPAGEPVGYRVLFEIAYHPGQLTAVTYSDGKETGKTILCTAGNGRKLETDSWYGDQDGLVFVDIFLTDEQGILAADEAGDLSIEVEGDIRLMGFGTGDPKPFYHYTGMVTRVFGGRAMAILKKASPERSGRITLRYSESAAAEVII